jgi:glycyl-tRNA synthetase beta chain
MMTKNILVELLIEELPPKALKKLGESFASSLFEGLKTRDLLHESSVATSYASPRRLAAHISNVAETAADKEHIEKLMPISVAFCADGKPADAFRKRLAKIGREAMADLWPNAEVGPDRLFVQNDGKADAIFLRTMISGASLRVGLEFAIEEALEALPIPKVMTYQLYENCDQPGWTSVKFVRPAHKLVVLYGNEVIDVLALGLKSGRETQGHRFEAKNPVVSISDADSYAEQMKTEGTVIASFTERRTEIERQLNEAAAKQGLKPIEDEALLDEVTALVERPNVLLCKFDEQFLEVPQECLILTMKVNQKYFPLLDENGKLTNKFLIVSNIRPADPSLIIGGNERVVRPRLADAKFFFDQDRKKQLEDRILGLAKVVYHNKLGSQGDRVERVQAIARAIAQQLGGDALAAQADQAALLAKADLLTDMVGEFPELQGIMGRYYAQHDGLSDDIALAIEDHYRPRFAGDELPRNKVGICVALADKLETLLGMFGIGEIPTGDKDPFALRRHALGVIRMLIEKNLSMPIDELLEDSFALMPSVTTTLGQNAKGAYTLQKDAPVSVLNFIYERLSGYLREQGYSAQEVDATLSLRPQLLNEVPKRLSAVRAFASLPESAALAAANKRVGNILKKEGITTKVDAVIIKLLQEPAELALHQALSKIAPKAEAAFKSGDYAASLQELATLREPVDTFFDNVMVNAEDSALRTNRLSLLSQLHQAMNRVADISKLAA